MTDQHPITPPPELVQQWWEEVAHRQYGSVEADEHIAEQAAQWGADQELEACAKWVQWWDDLTAACQLRAARRPKPPSLKQQALKAVAAIEGDFNTVGDRAATIRLALEQLPN